jgi:hypothetical protein
MGGSREVSAAFAKRGRQASLQLFKAHGSAEEALNPKLERDSTSSPATGKIVASNQVYLYVQLICFRYANIEGNCR